MTTKALSTSTLSLRFMQNADRAKNLKQVEAEKAQIKSDAEWEVAKEVRDAWGPTSSKDEQKVTYEPSYLPFLFPSLSESDTGESPTKPPKGRRAFNKKGEEIVTETVPTMIPATPSIDPSSSRPSSKTRPGLSSSSSPTKKLLSRPVHSQKSKEEKKSAKEAIHDNTGVGSDLRAAKLTMPPPRITPLPFLKPAGFEDLPTNPVAADATVVMGARRNASAKRQLSATDNDATEGEGKKRKKKKKSTE